MSGSSRFPKENLTLLLVRESSARRREAGFRFNSEYDHTIVDNGFDECKIEDDYNGYNDNNESKVVDDDGEEQWLSPERRIKPMHTTSVKVILYTTYVQVSLFIVSHQRHHQCCHNNHDYYDHYVPPSFS